MKYKLAVFDLDGTILDTLDDLANSLNYALDIKGFPCRTKSEVRNFVGNGIRKLIERAVPEGTCETAIQTVHQIFTEHYKTHCKDLTAPYPGIPELLSALRQSGYLTAVVSNKVDYAVQILCRNYFPSCFDFVVGERVGIRRKPCPDSLNEVLSVLKIDREEAVYIGDSNIDIETARNARMDAIIVDWGFRDRSFLIEHGAKTIVSSPDEMKKILLD